VESERTTWVKVRNSTFEQWEGREELFGRKHHCASACIHPYQRIRVPPIDSIAEQYLKLTFCDASSCAKSWWVNVGGQSRPAKLDLIRRLFGGTIKKPNPASLRIIGSLGAKARSIEKPEWNRIKK
jgi:hypothetical protein